MRRGISASTLSVALSPLLLSSLARGDRSNVLQVSLIDTGHSTSIWLHVSDDPDILIKGARLWANPALVFRPHGVGSDDIERVVSTYGDSNHIDDPIELLQPAVARVANKRPRRHAHAQLGVLIRLDGRTTRYRTRRPISLFPGTRSRTSAGTSRTDRRQTWHYRSPRFTLV